MICLLGIVLGFMLGAKATRDAFGSSSARPPSAKSAGPATGSPRTRRNSAVSPIIARMPNFELSDEEKQLSETARDFARKEIIPVAGELDEHGTFPAEICKKGWETGLMNCEIPEAYGGLGLSCLAHCLVLEEISYGCTGVNTTMAGNMLGTMPLIIAGTDAQKKRVLRAPAGRADLRRLLLLRARRRLRRGRA